MPIAALGLLDRLRQARVRHPVEDVADRLRMIGAQHIEDLAVQLLEAFVRAPFALYRACTVALAAGAAHTVLREVDPSGERKSRQGSEPGLCGAVGVDSGLSNSPLWVLNLPWSSSSSSSTCVL